MTDLPAIPDDDADFTPELAREIIVKYQQIIRDLKAEVVSLKERLEEIKSIGKDI